jgi:hypothetical protein
MADALARSIIPDELVPDSRRVSELNTGVPHIARIYDFWLGGKDNFAADRAVARQMSEINPHIAEGVRASRAFLQRAVRYLAAEAGIGQFLDIGTGLPSPGNTHEVAQAVNPAAHVVYTDNDPIVLAHARALLISDPRGATGYLDADVRDPDAILAGAVKLLDFGQPVAVILGALLHVIADEEDPYAIVARLMAQAPAGSYLVISHGATDIAAEMMAVMSARLSAVMPCGQKPAFRDRAGVARFFTGFELAEPGLVPITEWRSDGETDVDPGVPVPMWGAVGRKI